MKKVSILLIALMVISVGVLSGCEEQRSANKNDFIGTWRVVEISMGNVSFGVITMTFYTDDTLYTEHNYTGLEHDFEEDVFGAWFNWEIEDNRLCTTPQGTEYTTCSDYEFTNGGNSLTVTYIETVLIVLEKLSNHVQKRFDR